MELLTLLQHLMRNDTYFFNSDDSKDTEAMASERQISGELILREVESASRKMRLGTAGGENRITADFMLKKENPLIDFFVVFFNKIYEEGKFPWKWSTFIPQLKKPKARECTDFKVHALMSHLTKVRQKILVNRIKKVEKQSKWKPAYIPTRQGHPKCNVCCQDSGRMLWWSECQSVFLFHRLHKSVW